MGSFSNFLNFIEFQTLNEKCCVFGIICFSYQIERCNFLENLISFGSVKITSSTTTYTKIGVLSAVSCNSSLEAITTFDNAKLPYLVLYERIHL